MQASDTCASIIQAQGNGITGIQLLAWNPDINSLCGNLYNLKGNYICVRYVDISVAHAPPIAPIHSIQPILFLSFSNIRIVLLGARLETWCLLQRLLYQHRLPLFQNLQTRQTNLIQYAEGGIRYVEIALNSIFIADSRKRYKMETTAIKFQSLSALL